RPIICQNFDFDRTGLKNTRLSTSGTSMPVSSMSTLMAMSGCFAGCEKSGATPSTHQADGPRNDRCLATYETYVARHHTVASEGFEPPKAEPSDLQSDPFGRLGNSPSSGCEVELASGTKVKDTRILGRPRTPR